MPTLLEKQQSFSTLVARLIDQTTTLGYHLTLGECWRPHEMAEIYAERGLGVPNSLHTKRLAIDINLFQNGKYLTDSASYQPLGEWWEAQSTPDLKLCWGGRFKRKDGNHFSIEHEGVK